MTKPATPSDPEVRTGKVDTGSFTYTDQGEGPIIAAVHGLPGSVRDYRWLAAALPKTVRFVRLDMPGFGGTPLETDRGVTFDARGAFVARALEALEIERCVLIGHSMGGPVAISAAAQAPHRVTGLALLSSVGLRPHRLLRRFPGRALWVRMFDTPGIGRLARPAMMGLFRATGFPSSTTEGEMVHTVRCLARVDYPAQNKNVAALKVPTLAAWARDDQYIEKEVFEELAAALPQGPRLSWDKGGHNIQKTWAVELAEALLSMVPRSP